jgi:peptidoglycan/LPS O-acetylase OafA/YrhL
LIDTREAENYFRSFYARRALRIFPLYYWTLIIVFFVIPRIAPTAAIPPTHDRIYYFFYLNNCISFLHQSNNFQYVGHFWSLAVEEQFYWVWPLFVFIIPTRFMKWAVLTAVAVGFGAWVYMFYFVTSPDAGRFTLLALPSLMAGAICAQWVREPQSLKLLVKASVLYLPSAIVLFLAYALLRHKHSLTAVFAGGLALNLSFMTALLAALFGPGVVRKFFELSPLRSIGRYSYGMYVYHIAIITGFGHYFPGIRGVEGGILIFAICYVVAALSYELVEKRINALKVRFRARFENPAGVPAEALEQPLKALY